MSKEVRHKKKRAKILDTARTLALENGFDQLSLREIARRINLSPASLYEYFRGKDDIIDALCIETDAQMAEHMMMWREERPQEHPLLSIGCAYVHFALMRPDEFQLLYHRPLDEPANAVSSLLSQYIKQSLRSGEFYAGFGFDETEMAQTFWALIHGQSLLALTRGIQDEPDDLKVIKEAIQRLITGLRS